MVKYLSILLVFGAATTLAVSLAAQAPDETSDKGACTKNNGGCPATACTAEKWTATSIAGTCTDGKCTAGVCTDGKCTEGQCTDGKCTEGKCIEGQCTEGQCTDGKCTDGKCCGTCGGTCTDKAVAVTDVKECPIAAAMKQLPQMTYVVGDQKTCCPKSAAELAKKSDAKMMFVVADKEFGKQADAHLALVKATETFVSSFVEPKVCEKTGTCTVAGKKACCPNTAAATSKMLKTAMGKVKMSYVVGDKTCGCPVQAKQLAKDSGNITEYVVSGEKTCCDVTARLNLARAKYKAAVEAMVQTESKASETDDS